MAGLRKSSVASTDRAFLRLSLTPRGRLSFPGLAFARPRPRPADRLRRPRGPGHPRSSGPPSRQEGDVKIHEFQAKEILRRYGVATPRGRVTEDPEEAARICEELGGRCVVKAQIHAGGRGKGGGVKLAKSPEEAREKAGQILGMQ